MVHWGPKFHVTVKVVSTHKTEEEAEKAKPEDSECVDGKWSEFTKYVVTETDDEVDLYNMTGCC